MELKKNFKVFLEGLAQWVLLEIRDLLVSRVLTDLLEQGREVYQEVQHRKVSKECQVLLETTQLSTIFSLELMLV